MRSNRLRVFECATIAKIGGDAGRPKRVVANRGKDRPLRRGGGLAVRRQASGAFGPEILGLHARGRAHAREDVGEGGFRRDVLLGPFAA